MPKKPCTKDGKPGKKWGDKGACYTGEDADEKVRAQQGAIETSKARGLRKLKRGK